MRSVTKYAAATIGLAAATTMLTALPTLADETVAATGDLVVTRFDDRYSDGLFDTTKTSPAGEVDRPNTSHAAQLIDVNGTRWYLSSDAAGVYRFTGVPVGPATLYLGYPNQPASEVLFDATGATSAADIVRLPTTQYFGDQGTLQLTIGEGTQERLIGMSALRLVTDVRFADGTPATGLTSVELGSGTSFAPATEYSFQPGTYEAFTPTGYVRHLPGDLGVRVTPPAGYSVASVTATDGRDIPVTARDGAWWFSSTAVGIYFWNPTFTVTLADTARPVATLVSPTTAGPFRTLSVGVDATDNAGLQRIVANIYSGGTLVKSTQTRIADGATTGSHRAEVTLPDGSYTVRYNAQDLAGNISTTSTAAFTIDTTAPTATVKDGATYTVATGTSYDLISFKLFDAGKIDKVVLNGKVKDLTNNAWSDLNFVKPGTFGAVRGENTLVVHDVAGNTRTITFVLN